MIIPLEAAQVGKAYPTLAGPVVAVSEVSLSVPAGHLCVIAGSNGSGKSTLLGLMSGLLAPDQGSVRWFGHDLRHTSRSKLSQVRGLVHQSPARGLCDDLSVEEMSRVYLDGARNAAEPSWAWLERSGIPKGRVVHELSGGQRQLLTLELALSRSPKVLFLDEPTASLDFSHARTLEERLKSAVGDGTCVVMVSHDLEQALRLADSLLLLHAGREIGFWPSRPSNRLTTAALRDHLKKAFGES